MIGIGQHEVSNNSAKINAKYIVKVLTIEKENRIFHETTYSESGRNRRSDNASGS